MTGVFDWLVVAVGLLACIGVIAAFVMEHWFYEPERNDGLEVKR